MEDVQLSQSGVHHVQTLCLVPTLLLSGSRCNVAQTLYLVDEALVLLGGHGFALIVLLGNDSPAGSSTIPLTEVPRHLVH